MQSETTRGQGGGWLLLVLALPLCVVVLERVVLPLVVRWVCRGRATVRSASLVRGVQDLVWGDVIRVPYAYVRCQARMPCLVLHVRGLRVAYYPRDATAPAPAVRRVSRRALVALSFLANLVAIEAQDTHVALPGATAFTSHRIYVHASVLLRYLAPQPTHAAACDGFDDAPAVPPRRALRLHVPEARARLCIDVDDARLLQQGHTLLTLPHRTTLSVQARLRHTIQPASLSIRVHIADAHLTAWPTIARSERAAAPRAPPAVLTYLASASLSVSRATATLPVRGADPVCTTLTHFHVSLDPSRPTHGVHQAWFGACGVQRRRDAIVLHEARRVFALHLRLASWHAQIGPMHTHIAHVSCWARTSCTPYGVLTSEPRWSDPNEAALVLRASVGHVRVQPHWAYLARLVPLLRTSSSRPPPPPPPRVAALVQLGALDVHAPDGLRIHIARTHLSVRGAYVERRGACPMQYTLEASAGCGVVDAYVLSAQVRHDLLHIAAPTATYTLCVPVGLHRETFAPQPHWPERDADVALAVHRIDVHMWSEPVVRTTEALIRAIASHESPREAHESPHAGPRHVHVHVGGTAVYVGGADAHFEPHVRRGVGLVLGATVVDYARATSAPLDVRVRDARQALGLPRPIEHLSLIHI